MRRLETRLMPYLSTDSAPPARTEIERCARAMPREQEEAEEARMLQTR